MACNCWLASWKMILSECSTKMVLPVAEVPLMDFDSGYVQRLVHTLPRQGTEAPWWGAISPKRRQEFALVGAVLGLIGVVVTGAVIGRRLWRRSRPG